MENHRNAEQSAVSEPLKPIWALLAKWRTGFTLDGDSTYMVCATELEAALRAWDEAMLDVGKQQSGSVSVQSVRLRLLGVPPE